MMRLTTNINSSLSKLTLNMDHIRLPLRCPVLLAPVRLRPALVRPLVTAPVAKLVLRSAPLRPGLLLSTVPPKFPTDVLRLELTELSPPALKSSIMTMVTTNNR